MLQIVDCITILRFTEIFTPLKVIFVGLNIHTKEKDDLEDLSTFLYKFPLANGNHEYHEGEN